MKRLLPPLDLGLKTDGWMIRVTWFLVVGLFLVLCSCVHVFVCSFVDRSGFRRK